MRLAFSIFTAVTVLVTVLLLHGEGWPVLIAFAWPAAMQASTAFPPSASTAAPTSAVSGCPAAIAPRMLKT